MSGQPGRAFARRHDDRGWRLRYIAASKKAKRKASATYTTRRSSARKGVLRNAQGRHGRAASGIARTTSPPTLRASQEGVACLRRGYGVIYCVYLDILVLGTLGVAELLDMLLGRHLSSVFFRGGTLSVLQYGALPTKHKPPLRLRPEDVAVTADQQF